MLPAGLRFQADFGNEDINNDYRKDQQDTGQENETIIYFSHRR